MTGWNIFQLKCTFLNKSGWNQRVVSVTAGKHFQHCKHSPPSVYSGCNLSVPNSGCSFGDTCSNHNLTMHIQCAFKVFRQAYTPSSSHVLGLHGIFLPVLRLLQQHTGWEHRLLLQHPTGLPLHCCFLLRLLSHLYHRTVSDTANTFRFSTNNQYVCVFSCLTAGSGWWLK